MNVENRPARVAVVMHALPHYRKDFFRLLAKETAGEIDFAVFHGDKVPGKRIKACSDIDMASFPVTLHAWEVLGLRIRRHVHLTRKVLDWNPDAVVCLFSPGYISYIGLLLRCEWKGIPYVLWGCGYSRPEVTGWKAAVRRNMFDRFFRKASALIAYGKTYANVLSDQGHAARRLFVAQNTVDVESIAARAAQLDRHACRRSLGWSNDRIVYLFVGVMTPEKRLPELLDAFKTVHTRHPTTCLVLVGSGTVKAELDDKIRQYDLAGSVSLPGEKYGNELELYFAGADAFVMPGTGGLGVNEAMAYGLPAITNYGDGTIPDIVEDGATGHILSASGDLVTELVESMEHLAGLTKTERHSIGVRARSGILSRAPLCGMVEGFREACLHALSEGRRD